MLLGAIVLTSRPGGIVDLPDPKEDDAETEGESYCANKTKMHVKRNIKRKRRKPDVF